MQKNRFLQQLDPAPKENVAQPAEQQAPIAASPNQFLSQLEGKEKPPEEEGWVKNAFRKALQVPAALAQIPSSILDFIDIMGTGNAYNEMQELQREIPRLKEIWPNADWDKVEKLTDEEIAKAAHSASENFPTQHKAEEFIERKTGLPLQAKTRADQLIRLGTTAGALKQGPAALKSPSGGVLERASPSFGSRAAASVVAPLVSANIEKAGAPAWLSDLAGLFAGNLLPKLPGKQTSGEMAEALIGKEPIGTRPFKTAESISQEAEDIIRSRGGGGGPPPAPPSPPPAPIKPEPAPLIPKKAEPIPEPLLADVKVEPLPQPKPVKVEVPEVPTSGEGSLAGRIKKEKTPTQDIDKLGKVVSKEPLQSSAQTGRTLAETIKENAKEAKIPVTAAYKEAEAATAAHSDVYDGLAKNIDEFIQKLELTEKRNAAQEAVYQQAKTIQDMIGKPGALLEENAQKLVLQADAMAQMVNYELPYTGYKSQIKGLVKSVNEAVIESLESAGKTSEAEVVKNADKMYAQWADRFLGDELTPYLERKNLNPESLFEKPTSDVATHRAVRKAVGNNSDPLVQRIDSNVVKQEMGKYFENPELVNSTQYQKDIVDLAERIGKEEVGQVDHFLRNRKTAFEKQKSLKEERGSFVKRKLLEPAEKQSKKVESPKLKSLSEKISNQQKQLAEKQKVEVRNLEIERKNLKRQRDYEQGLEHQKGMHEHRTKKEQIQYERKKELYDRKVEDLNKKYEEAVEKSKKISAPSTDEVLAMADQGTTGIRKLKSISSDKNFDTFMRQKARSIITEGNITDLKNVKGSDFARVMKKEKNHEFFSEWLGEDKANAALEAATKLGDRVMTAENMKEFAEKALALKFISHISHLIPGL